MKARGINLTNSKRKREEEQIRLRKMAYGEKLSGVMNSRKRRNDWENEVQIVKDARDMIKIVV